jgi:hypothetical protein
MNDISANLDGHPIEIVEVDGRYVCIVPTLLLTASDSDLTVAYADVRAKRQRLIEDAQAAGVAHRLSSGTGSAASALSASRNAGLASFAIRTSIVTVAAALLVVLAGTIASLASRRAADAFASRLEAAAPFSRDWDKRAVAFQEWLYEAAAPRNQPTPAQEAKIRESLRTLVARFRPYIAELAPLTDTQRAQDPIVQPPSPVKN